MLIWADWRRVSLRKIQGDAILRDESALRLKIFIFGGFYLGSLGADLVPLNKVV